MTPTHNMRLACPQHVTYPVPVAVYVRCVRTDGSDHAHGDRREVAGGGPSASPAHAARTGHRLQEELLSGGQADAGTGSLYILSSGSGA